MNILKKLLFSYEGKIGRADFIYGIIYGYLLAFVSLDALLQPRHWQLIGSGLDIGFILQYGISIPGIICALWILTAVLTKRAHTLWYWRMMGILPLFVSPLVVVGFKKDSGEFLYNGKMSITDQIFFYVVLGLVTLSIWFIYQITLPYKFLFTILVIFAIFCVILFSHDRDPFHTYPRQRYIGIDSFLDVLFVIVIVFFIRLYIISPFQIIGPSMETTFHGWNVVKNANGQYGDGEFILVDKMTYRITTPRRGDVVVFSPRIGPDKKYLIKRVIGLPGDKIKIADKFVSIATAENPDTFVEIDESEYLKNNYGNTCIDIDCYSDPVTFTIPEKHYFLMWDNRPQSLDSRQCFGECALSDDIRFVPQSSISGRVAYSLGHFDMFERILPVPALGTLRQVIPWRGTNILNSHIYPELQ